MTRFVRWLWWLPIAFVVMVASPASAAAMDPAPEGEGSFLDVFGVTTSNGVSLSQWQLSIDPGGALGIGNPFVQIIQWGWMVWRVGCGAAIWAIDVAQNLLWLKLMRGPLATVVEPLVAVLHETKLAWLLGVVGVAIAFVSWRYGKTGAAILETIGVVVMFSLATGILADPVSGITDSGGVIEQVQGVGDEATATLGKGEGGSGASKTSQRLADLAIAQPAQLFNFGRLVPAKCQGVYAEALKKGPHEEDDAAVRDAVNGCDDSVKPQGVTMLFGTWVVLSPTLYTVMFFGGVLGVVVIGLGGWIVWLSVQLVWDAIKGIAPGSGRASLIITLTSIGVALVLFVLAMIFLAVGTQALLELYTYATGPEFGLDPFTVYLITDALIVLLAVMFVVKVVGAVRKARAKGEKIARSLSPKPRPMPQPVTQRLLNSRPGKVLDRATSSAVGNMVGNGALGQMLGAPARAGSGSKIGGASADGRKQQPKQGATGTPTGNAARGSKLKSTANLAGKAGALAFHSTLGLPVAAPKFAAAAKAAATQRSDAMRGKLSAARDRVNAVNDYGNEWTHNVGVAAKWTSRAVGASHAASLLAPPLAPVAAAASIALSARQERRRQEQQRPAPPGTRTQQHGSSTPGTAPKPPTAPASPTDGPRDARAQKPAESLATKLAHAKANAAKVSSKPSTMPYQGSGRR